MSNLTEIIEFTPDKSVQVAKESAIKLLCTNYRSHEAGLPEWLKNSSDSHIRSETDSDSSLILCY